MGAAESKLISGWAPADVHEAQQREQYESSVRDQLKAQGTPGLRYDRNDTRYPNEQAMRFSRPDEYRRAMNRQRHHARNRAQSEAVNHRPSPSQLEPRSAADAVPGDRQQRPRPRSADGPAQGRRPPPTTARRSERLPTYEEATTEEALLTSALVASRNREPPGDDGQAPAPAYHAEQDTIGYITAHAEAMTLSTSAANRARSPATHHHHNRGRGPSTSFSSSPAVSPPPLIASAGRRPPHGPPPSQPPPPSARPGPAPVAAPIQGLRRPGDAIQHGAVSVPDRLTGDALSRHERTAGGPWQQPRPLRRSSYSIISEFRHEQHDRRKRDRRNRALSLAARQHAERRLRSEQTAEAASAYRRW